MKPGLHVVEIRDRSGNLHRKAVVTGCLDVLRKVAEAWLARALWFAAGLLVGLVWNG